MPKPNTKIAVETLETALVILGEWNHGSASRIELDTAQGRRWLMEAIDTAQALEKIERALSRSAVHRCNYPMNEAEEKARDKREGRLQREAIALVKPWNLSVRFGGDPRGTQLAIMATKTDRHNTWGGAASGWAV